MTEPLQIHGFRVVPVGRLSKGFRAGLRALASRGFADASCTIVKTESGARSGITHVGGRYVHQHNAYEASVATAMSEQGIDPPPTPFIVAPGKGTLFHEWGHHVDRVWSRGDRAVLFSFRWLSQFYELSVRHPPADLLTELRHWPVGPIGSPANAATAATVWWRAASELFADLFEDWMRGKGRVSWDCCEPAHLNGFGNNDLGQARIDLLPDTGPDMVREAAYALFEKGPRGGGGLPEVRGDLFGEHTDSTLAGLARAMDQVHSEAKDRPDGAS